MNKPINQISPMFKTWLLLNNPSNIALCLKLEFKLSNLKQYYIWVNCKRNFSPENTFKSLSISLHDSKTHINTATTATHIPTGSWLMQFQFQFCLSLLPCWLTENWKQSPHIKDLKVLLNCIYAVLLIQGASFIYSWLTSRKKRNPRRKLALRKKSTIS